MDSFNRFHVTHKTDFSKLLPYLTCIYSVVASNEINLTSIQVQVKAWGVFKKTTNPGTYRSKYGITENLFKI